VGKILVLVGILISIVGLLLMGIERITRGRGLPGDITMHRDGVNISIPIVSMIVVSIILSLLLTLVVNLLFRR
jgi:hypothetical protein